MNKNNHTKLLFYKQIITFTLTLFSLFAHADVTQPIVGELLDTKQAEDIAEVKVVESNNNKLTEQEHNPSFNVFEFKVDGNTVLPVGKIEEAVYPFLGEAKTIDDVEKARTALEKIYQDSGYLTVSVSIPHQEVNVGIVKLLVTEGKVERLRVKDSKYFSLSEIKSRITEFEEGKVPNFPVAQLQLGTVNRGQNRQVTPILRAGKSPGKIEIDLKVQDQFPLHGNVELNDKYSSNTTETRLNGSLRYENLWQKDHSIGISFQISPEELNEVKVVSATYLIPRLNGDYFAAYGVISKSDISAVGDVNVIGNGYISGVRYIHPLPMIENYYQSITFGADYKDFKETVSLLGADGFKTPISYSAFLLGYDVSYQGKSSQVQLNLGFNFALRGLNSQQEFRNKRYLAEPNFGYLKTEIKYLQKLPYEWSIQARLNSQIANGPLISAEQFAIGGVDSVRGYLESAALGDNGITSNVEIRSPPLQRYLKNNISDYVKELYAYSFIDAGYVSIYEPLFQEKSSDLMSLGMGVKFKSTNGIFTTIDYAHALRDSGLVKNGDDRFHFRVGYDL
jgi:hemolysin activation/secretion protein